jgi:predicted restriction endonuclease
MKPELAGKMTKQNRWANKTRIKDLITAVRQTRTIEIMTEMTIANEHPQHTTVIKIMKNDLAMIMDVRRGQCG